MYNLIAIEGADGLGKTEISKIVCERIKYRYVKFPNEKIYSGKLIRDVLRGNKDYHPATFQVLNAVNKQLTNLDGNCLCDRYILSQLIYGLLDGVDEKFLLELWTNLKKPTITFVFTGKTFRKDDEIFGQRGQEIAKLYEDFLAKNVSDKSIIRINVNKDFEETVEEIIEHIWQKGV